MTRPNPSEKDSSVASNHSKGKGKVLVVLQHPLWFSIRLVLGTSEEFWQFWHEWYIAAFKALAY